jgi:flagellar assembly factor FliW
LETTRFGVIEIEAEKIIHMPSGMLGFPRRKRFVIVQHKENSPFFWYQSVDDPGLAFVIANPFLFVPDYKSYTRNILRNVCLEEEETKNQAEFYVVVNIPKGEPQKMTANLIGPIMINNKKRRAIQVVLHESPYSHKFPLAGKTEEK